MKFINTTNRINKPEFSEDARKAISLLYFEEALYKEQYEECPALVEAAKGFGAEASEINKIIAKHLKGNKYGLPKRNEAKEPIAGRRRF